MSKFRVHFVFVWISLLCSTALFAGEIRVAVASNFNRVMDEIVQLFQQQYGHKVTPVYGSTGKHYIQIKNGAPFEAFFAADVKHPQLLENEGWAQRGSRFTYAIGKMVLWSPDSTVVDSKGIVLQNGSFHHLAVANPKLAPYGEAAKQIMHSLHVMDKLGDRLVFGENINQTLQFVKSGHAQLGFVAYSQIQYPNRQIQGSFWMPSQSLYEPIAQQAILLKDNAIAREFLHFMKNDKVRKLIQSYGYDVL